MQEWVAASSIAVLVATVPLCWVYRVFQDLPPPLALFHRRWPLWANLLIIGAATASTTVLIRRIYYDAAPAADPRVEGLRLVIAALIYVLAFVLLIRQYVGLYPEYFVAAGRGGFTVRKRLYRNVVGLKKVGESHGETEVRLRLKGRGQATLHVPNRDLGLLSELIGKSRPEVREP